MSSSEVEENNLTYLDINQKKLCVGDCVLLFENNLIVDEKWKLKAEETLGETPELMKSTKEVLIKMLQEEKELNFPIDNEHQILRFLRLYHYDVVKAFKAIQRHFQFRFKNPHLSKDLLPTVIYEPFVQNVVLCLPERDQEGRRVMYLRIGKNWRPSECPLSEILRTIMLLGEGVGYEPISQINGALIICDMEGFSFDKIFSMTPSTAKSMVDYLQKASPSDVQGIHFINQPSIFGKVFGIFKPFIHERFRDRVYFHGDMKGKGKDSLFKYIHADHLPVWLGGQLNFPKEYGPQQREWLCLFLDLYEDNLTWGYKKDTN